MSLIHVQNMLPFADTTRARAWGLVLAPLTLSCTIASEKEQLITWNGGGGREREGHGALVWMGEMDIPR